MGEQLPERSERPQSSPAPSGVPGEQEALAEADDLLRRLAGWDVMAVEAQKGGEGDGPFWLLEILRVRTRIAESLPERSDGPDVSPPSAGSGLEESATRKDEQREAVAEAIQEAYAGRYWTLFLTDETARALADAALSVVAGAEGEGSPSAPLSVALDDVVALLERTIAHADPVRALHIEQAIRLLRREFASPEGGGTE